MSGGGHAVDWDRIADSVEMACQIRGMTLRDVAVAVGVSPSSMTRLRQGKHLSADALAALVAWLFPGDVPFWIKACSCSGRHPMTASEDQPEGYGLVMPFVSVASNGGPYDDDAYAAGWAMGALDATLRFLRPPTHDETVRAADVAQADLVAMKHGYRMDRAESGMDEWVFCSFTADDLGGVG